MMWEHGWWGPPMGGFWWIFPLFGLALLTVCLIGMIRAMRHGGGFACAAGHRDHSAPERDELARQIGELREEIRQLRGAAPSRSGS